MKFFGNANMQQNKVLTPVLDLVGSFPTDPKVGQLAFTQGILYICIQIVDDTPYWAPLTKFMTSYTHVQGVASDEWTIPHNLNTNAISVTVYDTDNKVLIPDEIETDGLNSAIVRLGYEATGKAVILTGNPEGSSQPAYSYEEFVTPMSDEWVIVHALGYNPIVRVFIGNEEVQPLSIVHDSTSQVTITFSTPLTGWVKLI